MVVVADTSPINYLVLIGQIDLLIRLYTRILIPPAVLAELKPAHAQLLILRASDHSYRELAETLGIEPSSVGTLLVRAEAAFEERFREMYGREEGL